MPVNKDPPSTPPAPAPYLLPSVAYPADNITFCDLKSGLFFKVPFWNHKVSFVKVPIWNLKDSHSFFVSGDSG
jgi:hypothetical protein